MMLRRRGFTLIELLVVIAVIALLIGILLPAIGKARETGWATVCLSNMSQISKAANMYANDYKDQLWPQFEWAPLQYQLSNMATPAIGAGVMYQYVDKTFNVNECPKNKRKSINGAVNTAIDPQFGVQLGVGFDYCMIGRFQGVRAGADVVSAYVTKPETYAAGAKGPLTMASQASLTLLTGTPIYVEESSQWYNSGITDGLWGNADQVTRRHFLRGNVAFFEGHVAPWKIPTSRAETTVQDARDMDCNDLYVTRGGASNWVRLEPDNTDNRANWSTRGMGWANAPKP